MTMRKFTMLAAGAVGYVLGARAGRERYEQIKAGAGKLASDPRVQRKARQAGDAVREKAPDVKETVVGAASTATTKVKEKVGAGEPAPVTGTDPRTSTPYPEG